MRVILSIPHGLCIDRNKKTRHCDILAEPFGRKIEKSLKKRGMEVSTFFSDMLRNDVDMNRKEGRKTRFRANLDLAIENLSCDDVLLDVHSAPSDTLEYAFEVYLLDMYGIDKDDMFNENLYTYLKHNGVRMALLHGEKRNDITARAMIDFGLKNVSLVEINESLDDKRVEEIAEIIAGFIEKECC